MLFILFIVLNLSFNLYSEVRIVAVGDFMPGSTYPKPILLSKEKLDEICENIKQYIPQADIKIFNLEGVLTTSTQPFKRIKKTYYFAIPPEYVTIIKKLGFNTASLVNNHVLDFGLSGYKETVKILEENQIKYAGEKGEFAEFIVKEKKVCVVSFGFTYPKKFYSILNINEAKKVVTELKEKYDIVIVSFHGGKESFERTFDEMEEFLSEKRGNLIAFSHAVIDAGADLVIGHGPHVPRALELYKKKLIVYSLGNFFTYARFNLEGIRSYAPMIYVLLDDEGNFKEGKIIPFIQTGLGIPVFDNEKKVVKLIKKLTELDFPQTTLHIDEEGNLQIKQY